MGETLTSRLAVKYILTGREGWPYAFPRERLY